MSKACTDTQFLTTNSYFNQQAPAPVAVETEFASESEWAFSNKSTLAFNAVISSFNWNYLHSFHTQSILNIVAYYYVLLK